MLAKVANNYEIKMTTRSIDFKKTITRIIASKLKRQELAQQCRVNDEIISVLIPPAIIT